MDTDKQEIFESLLERNYYENVSIIGPDYVPDELDEERPPLFIYYPPEDSPQWPNSARARYGGATPNGRGVPQKPETPAKNTMNTSNTVAANRSTDDINGMIMEGLKKILRSGTLPQLTHYGGGVTANNAIAKKRKNNNKNKNIGAGGDSGNHFI